MRQAIDRILASVWCRHILEIGCVDGSETASASGGWRLKKSNAEAYERGTNIETPSAAVAC
ncbi:MAG: hypothetical protein ACKESB_03580 [Candidatus Hodgkinia cicadicola]